METDDKTDDATTAGTSPGGGADPPKSKPADGGQKDGKKFDDMLFRCYPQRVLPPAGIKFYLKEKFKSVTATVGLLAVWIGCSYIINTFFKLFSICFSITVTNFLMIFGCHI